MKNGNPSAGRPTEFRQQLKEWQKAVEAAFQREEIAVNEVSSLKEERDQLQNQLDEACTRIQGLHDLQKQFIENIGSMLPIIEVKKRLVTEVAQLKQEKKEADIAHMEEVSRSIYELEIARIDGNKTVEATAKDASKKVKELEAKHKEALAKKDEEIKAAKDKLLKEKNKNNDKLSDLRKHNHKEQEHLRNRIAQMQQNQSSSVVSNMDLIANKLQAARAEYEVQLEEKDILVQERDLQMLQLKEELRKSQEDLRHQRHLNVVRGVVTRAKKAKVCVSRTRSQTLPECSATVEDQEKGESSKEEEECENEMICMSSDISPQP